MGEALLDQVSGRPRHRRDAPQGEAVAAKGKPNKLVLAVVAVVHVTVMALTWRDPAYEIAQLP